MPKLLDGQRVYVLGGNTAIERIFQDEGAQNVSNLQDATMVCFTGGEDVTPELYGELRHPTTFCNPRRDAWEQACYLRAKDKIKIGICRGGQFLNVMNGGTLWQDVDNHAMTGEHHMTYQFDLDGDGKAVLSREIRVTSTHHQMMIPNLKGGAKVWGWASRSTIKRAGLKNKATGVWLEFKMSSSNHNSDCEIIYYNDTRSLCFQPHPEYNSSSTREIFFTCIERMLAA